MDDESGYVADVKYVDGVPDTSVAASLSGPHSSSAPPNDPAQFRNFRTQEPRFRSDTPVETPRFLPNPSTKAPYFLPKFPLKPSHFNLTPLKEAPRSPVKTPHYVPKSPEGTSSHHLPESPEGPGFRPHPPAFQFAGHRPPLPTERPYYGDGIREHPGATSYKPLQPSAPGELPYFDTRGPYSSPHDDRRFPQVERPPLEPVKHIPFPHRKSLGIA